MVGIDIFQFWNLTIAFSEWPNFPNVAHAALLLTIVALCNQEYLTAIPPGRIIHSFVSNSF